GKVYLRHVRAGPVTRVGDREARGDGIAADRVEVTVVEPGVAEAVPEGVERAGSLLRVPPVADLCTFVILDRHRCPPGRAQARELGTWRIGEALWPGDRRPPGGVDLAGKHLRNCLCARLPRVPRLD